MKYLVQPLHHAYLLVGRREEARAKLLSVLKEELGLELLGNPDFSDQEFETLSIEDARTLSSSQTRRSLRGRRAYLLSFYFATAEAQNALLKTLEEPTPDTSFFIIVPSASVLLPTVRSRLLRLDLGLPRSTSEDARAYLAASAPERLRIIEKMAKSENESRKSDFLFLLIGIEEEASRRFGGRIPKEWAEPLRELFALKRYAFDRGSSVKMLGEYLSLRLPQLESRG